MVIEVNKDIDRYQESVAMGLTARQLIFSIASVVVGGGIVLLLYKYIGLTGSAYVAIPCVAPIAPCLLYTSQTQHLRLMEIPMMPSSQWNILMPRQ